MDTQDGFVRMSVEMSVSTVVLTTSTAYIVEIEDMSWIPVFLNYLHCWPPDAHTREYTWLGEGYNPDKGLIPSSSYANQTNGKSQMNWCNTFSPPLFPHTVTAAGEKHVENWGIPLSVLTRWTIAIAYLTGRLFRKWNMTSRQGSQY